MKLLAHIKTFALLALVTLALPVMAMNLQQAMSALSGAKEQGLVGEQPNGYLGVVSASGDANEIVKLVNQARKEQYQKMAQDNGIALKDVETMAGQKAIEKTSRNHFVRVDGKWVKKS